MLNMNTAPSSSIRRSFYCCHMNSKCIRQFIFQGWSEVRKLSYVSHQLRCKLGPAAISTLVDHVSNIFRMSGAKKMIWSGTKRGIASMANAESIRNRTIVKNPTCPVCENCPTPFGSRPNPPIPLSQLGSEPKPTWSKFLAMFRNWAVFIDFFPEPFSEAGRQSLRSEVLCGNFERHSSFAPYGLLALRGISLKG